MAKISIQTQRSFDIGVDTTTVWEFLSNTELAVSHYPKLQSLQPMGDDQWLWKLQPIGGAGFSHQVVYAVHYRFDESAGSICWEPLDGHGNSRIRGSFQLQDIADGTRICLETSGELDVPVPFLLKRVAAPFVEKEFQWQINRFAKNLQSALTE